HPCRRPCQVPQRSHLRAILGANARIGFMNRLWQRGCVFVFAGTVFGALYAQHAFRQYPSVEGYETMPLPSDWQKSAEGTFARSMAIAADSMVTGGKGSRCGLRTIRAQIALWHKRFVVLRVSTLDPWSR